MNDDLEIARSMLRGAWRPPRPRRAAAAVVTPASFREIDGGELARQYATHRTIATELPSGDEAAAGRHSVAGRGQGGGKLRGWALSLRARLSAD